MSKSPISPSETTPAERHDHPDHADMPLTMSHPGPVSSEAPASQAGTVVTESHDAAFGD